MKQKIAENKQSASDSFCNEIETVRLFEDYLHYNDIKHTRIYN